MQADSAEQTYSEISTRIHQLESLATEDLKGEMQQLKKALMENTEACLLMKPEDIGELVKHLVKITGIAITQAPTVKKTRTAAKKLTAQELQDALNSDEF